MLSKAFDCQACGCKIDPATTPYMAWYGADQSISLPLPPNDLYSSAICWICYKDGPTMESRIRHCLSNKIYISGSRKSPPIPITSMGGKSFIDAPRVKMNDKSDGLICVGCQNYFSFVESNCPEGYRCFSCRN